MLPRVTLITDGSGTTKDDKIGGGYACILQFQIGERLVEKEMSGHLPPPVTNQIAELQALIEGLSALTRACEVTVISDSEYLVKGTNTWASQWASRGWRTSGGKHVANLAQWQKIYELKKLHKVTATWVRGHADHAGNIRVDELARQARLNVT